jgi:ribosomal protein S24E
MSITSETDILTIDAKIQKDFDEEKTKLSLYKERLDQLNITQSQYVPDRVRVELEKAISSLIDKVTAIETDRDRSFYIAETAELLERYKEKLKIPVKMSFTGKQVEIDPEKQDIIARYLDIAKKYIPISVKSVEKKSKASCINCSSKKDFVQEETGFVCQDCGAQQDILQHTTSYKDVDRVNISAKYSYDRKVHFRDCINQYQGKQNCTIEQKVYDDLENMFEKHHLLAGDKSTKKENRFSKITREHVLMFLKELGYSKHYENVILIHYNMTGKKPDDISHLEDKLLADFDLLVETYDKFFKNKVDRVNFISTQYVLYQLLLKHKHPCRKEDFVILKTVDRKSFHDTICSQLFSLLSWTFNNPLY